MQYCLAIAVVKEVIQNVPVRSSKMYLSSLAQGQSESLGNGLFLPHDSDSCSGNTEQERVGVFFFIRMACLASVASPLFYRVRTSGSPCTNKAHPWVLELELRLLLHLVLRCRVSGTPRVCVRSIPSLLPGARSASSNGSALNAACTRLCVDDAAS